MKKHTTLSDIRSHLFRHRLPYAVTAFSIGIVAVLVLFYRTNIPDTSVLGLNSAPVTFSPGATSFTQGSTQSIIINAHTGGTEVDGIQVVLNVTGNLPSVLAFVPANLQSQGLSLVKGEIIDNGGAKILRILFITTDPAEPFSASQNVEIGRLNFVAPGTGQMTLTADVPGTKIISNGTGDNLVGIPANTTYTFAAASSSSSSTTTSSSSGGNGNSDNLQVSNILTVGKRVGINTTNPLGMFQINSDATWNDGGAFRIQNTNPNDYTLLYASTDNGIQSSTIQSFKMGPQVGARPLLLNPQGGNVGIGTRVPTSTLSVNGTVTARQFVTAPFNNSWPDYVFEAGYKLRPLNELEEYIKANKRLPNIPSASEIQKDGLSLDEMQSKQMEKIEELTLYIIEQNKKLEAQDQQIKEQDQRMDDLEARLRELEK